VAVDNEKPLETVRVWLMSLDHRAKATVLIGSLRVTLHPPDCSNQADATAVLSSYALTATTPKPIYARSI